MYVENQAKIYMQLNDILLRNQTELVQPLEQPGAGNSLIFIKTSNGVKIDFEMDYQQD